MEPISRRAILGGASAFLLSQSSTLIGSSHGWRQTFPPVAPFLGNFGGGQTVHEVIGVGVDAYAAVIAADSQCVSGPGMFIGVTPFLKANPTPDDYNEEHLVEIGSTFFGPQPGYSLPLAIRVTNIPAQRFYNGLIVDWQVTGVGCRPKPVSGTGKVTLGGDRVRFEEVAEPPSPGEQGNEGELRVSREGIHAFVGGRWRTARYTDG